MPEGARHGITPSVDADPDADATGHHGEPWPQDADTPIDDCGNRPATTTTFYKIVISRGAVSRRRHAVNTLAFGADVTLSSRVLQAHLQLHCHCAEQRSRTVTVARTANTESEPTILLQGGRWYRAYPCP